MKEKILNILKSIGIVFLFFVIACYYAITLFCHCERSEAIQIQTGTGAARP